MKTTRETRAADVAPEKPMCAETIIAEAAGLVSPPHVCIKLHKLIHSGNATPKSIGKTISHDPNLVARMLMIANSLNQQADKEITTIEKAVRLLDKEDLYNLVIAITAARTEANAGEHFYSMDDYWQHSVYTGLCARYLANACNMADTDLFFVAGLLHDIGLPAMYSSRPTTRALMIEQCGGDEARLASLERQRFGFDHGDIGGALLKSWQLPATLIEAVTHHQQPAADPACAILHLAELITNALNLRQDPDCYIHEHAQYDPWSVLKLNRENVDFNHMEKYMNRKMTAIVGKLFSH